MWSEQLCLKKKIQYWMVLNMYFQLLYLQGEPTILPSAATDVVQGD